MKSFFDGFEKVAKFPAISRAFAKKLVRPAAYVGAGAGIGAGGYAVGKGYGKEEQLSADKKKFQQYLSADYQRDLANLAAAQEQAFLQGYQYGQEQSGLKALEGNLNKSKKK